MKRLGTVAALVLLLAGCGWIISGLMGTPAPVEAGISLQQALSDSSGTFARVTPGRHFEFPADYGAHPDYKTEWWYFTGNLKSDKERFGYQLTLFRVGVPGNQADNPSTWATDQFFMGHLALSRPARDKFYSYERLARGAMGLAGVRAGHIWLEDWTIERGEHGWTLRGSQQGVGIELTLEETKPVVLQGDGGYSRKGPEERQASYYVSQTRLRTTGTVSVADEKFDVEGVSWFDHEWSSEALAEGLAGWDWFSLQLDDQTELMLYVLRYEDGTIEPASSGSVIGVNGGTRNLSLDDFQVERLESYRSKGGVVYPSRWRVSIPSEGLSVEVTPWMADQEMVSRVPYWEGAVDVSGEKSGRPITGVGFVELTGYVRP